MRRSLVALSTAMLLFACSTTLPVTGAMERATESFHGSIEGAGYQQGTGILVLVSDRGTTCKGSFVYTSRRQGRGVMTCDDGRSGAFQLAAVGNTGSGSGELVGQRYTFRFGN